MKLQRRDRDTSTSYNKRQTQPCRQKHKRCASPWLETISHGAVPMTGGLETQLTAVLTPWEWGRRALGNAASSPALQKGTWHLRKEHSPVWLLMASIINAVCCLFASLASKVSVSLQSKADLSSPCSLWTTGINTHSNTKQTSIPLISLKE